MDTFDRLTQTLGKEHVKRNETLSQYTTFRIGGPADYFVTPRNEDDLKAVMQIAKEDKVPVYYMGKGSNLLFGDKGYRGVVVRLGKGLDGIRWLDETSVRAGAGISLSKLALEVAKRDLTGFEFATGIPGSLGGAVAMNAGAYGGEIKDRVVSVKAIDSMGNDLSFTKGELKLGYRSSVIQQEDYIVTGADFAFSKGEGTVIQATIKELNARRREKQPLEYPSAGSTFKRPQGRYAGELIEKAGLKGRRVGDAMVSEKHAGFVINIGNATAAEVLELIGIIQTEIEQRFQVKLEPEVRLVGEF